MHTFDNILQKHNAAGCDVLLVDAEGSDVRIMRSMIAACTDTSRPRPWPRAIRFECMGHSNQMEHGNAEDAIIRRLQREAGYLVVEVGADVTLVHGPTMRGSDELTAWAEQFDVSCRRCGLSVSPVQPAYAATVGPGFTQWMGDPVGYEHGTWCCRRCLSAESDRRELPPQSFTPPTRRSTRRSTTSTRSSTRSSIGMKLEDSQLEDSQLPGQGLVMPSTSDTFSKTACPPVRDGYSQRFQR